MTRLTVAIRVEDGTGRVLDVRVLHRADGLREVLPSGVNEAFDRGETEPKDGNARWVVRSVEVT